MEFNVQLKSQFKSIQLEDMGTIWTAFNKCKSIIENGHRLEYMSWRLWHEQQKKQESSIKQKLSSLLLSPAHNAYRHEVVHTSLTEKEYSHRHAQQTPSIDTSQATLTRPISQPIQYDNTLPSHCSTHYSSNVTQSSDSDDYEDEDYYISSDDLYDDEEEEEEYIHFTKTTPKQPTHHSLLSDLFEKSKSCSKPPSLISNSSSTLTQLDQSTPDITSNISSAYCKSTTNMVHYITVSGT
ncbi:hypothetical protein BDB01DRAFT_850440 [Pilobolus umbonatus]|nr:hypothetical protein BDB01DRAFT_850440 [Pilobolus umbonatus]